eukprot:TRINITY_DN21772_c0_g1_i1.p1 TRINITY_DN21772_c0_g1~~TRINITY_DN21772_c0_g1_i1.p1  ORF type:complete len:118 (-),score=3.46 TRINITY_DN21772_c0_g1_i1:934-1287(-)
MNPKKQLTALSLLTPVLGWNSMHRFLTFWHPSRCHQPAEVSISLAMAVIFFLFFLSSRWKHSLALRLSTHNALALLLFLKWINANNLHCFIPQFIVHPTHFNSQPPEISLESKSIQQ